MLSRNRLSSAAERGGEGAVESGDLADRSPAADGEVQEIASPELEVAIGEQTGTTHILGLDRPHLRDARAGEGERSI